MDSKIRKDEFVCSNIIIKDEKAILIPNRQITDLYNGSIYRIIIACNIPEYYDIPVYLDTTKGEIPILARYANNLYINRLKKRTCYSLWYGNKNDIYKSGQLLMIFKSN